MDDAAGGHERARWKARLEGDLIRSPRANITPRPIPHHERERERERGRERERESVPDFIGQVCSLSCTTPVYYILPGRGKGEGEEHVCVRAGGGRWWLSQLARTFISGCTGWISEFAQQGFSRGGDGVGEGVRGGRAGWMEARTRKEERERKPEDEEEGS